jgi:hypothetical protein
MLIISHYHHPEDAAEEIEPHERRCLLTVEGRVLSGGNVICGVAANLCDYIRVTVAHFLRV